MRPKPGVGLESGLDLMFGFVLEFLDHAFQECLKFHVLASGAKSKRVSHELEDVLSWQRLECLIYELTRHTRTLIHGQSYHHSTQSFKCSMASKCSIEWRNLSKWA